MQKEGFISQNDPEIGQALGILRQFRGARRRSGSPGERCELCSAELHAEHPHLVELASRHLVCACDPCALLFESAERAKYKRVSRQVFSLPGFAMSEAQWESLAIPINLAFFFHSSLEGRTMTFYPSPAGAVESLLPLASWNAIVDTNPVLRKMRPDVEALLANRISARREESAGEYFLAPIDACYRLVGIIRANWKGLGGGAEVWDQIHEFFASLRAGSVPATGGPDA